MAQRFAYPIAMQPQPEGVLLVTCPDLPEFGTEGDDLTDALVQGGDCLSLCLAVRIRLGESIPMPSPRRGRPVVVPEALIAAKAALYLTMREQGLSIVALAARLRCAETTVRRMLNPDHGTRIERLEAALAVLGRRRVVHTYPLSRRH